MSETIRPSDMIALLAAHRKFVCAAAFLLAIAATACTTANPKYRPPVDAMPSCHSAADCSAPTGVCDLAGAAEGGKCVQCTAAETTACTATTPICGTDHSCRGCTAHIECPSNVCLPTGACSDGTDVAFVDPTKAGMECTQTAPCPTLEIGLSKKRPYIKMTGSSPGNVVIKDQAVIILADRGARLTTSRAADLVQILGNSQVSIFDLEFVGSYDLIGEGISIPAGTTALVSLERVTISGNDGAGISQRSGTVNVTECTLTKNHGGGVGTSGGTLNMTRSTLSGNFDAVIALGSTVNIDRSTLSDSVGAGVIVSSAGGALNITQSMFRGNTAGGIVMHAATSFHITSNFIVDNGIVSGVFPPSDNGGITALPIPGSSSTIEFNTIVDNHAGSAMAHTAGLECQGGIDANYNLIFRNVGGVGNPQTTPGCNYGRSLLTAPANPGFVGNGDYHLTSDSPSSIRRAVDCPAGAPKDYDGDSRPAGGQCDLGADEYTTKAMLVAP